MGVIMQAAYRRGVGVSVPAPVDAETPNVDWWYDHIAKQVNSFAKAGFTAVLLPPVLKTMGGDGVGCDGYGVFDDYDLGSKNQQGSIATRFGTDELLRRLCAILKANGLDIYTDQVPHQRMGASGGVYRYLGADGKTKNGRFPKNPGCFFGVDAQGNLKPGYVPRDPVAGPISDDYTFGDELCPINSIPKGYVLQGLLDAGVYLTCTIDGDGYRIDDTKGQAIAAVKAFLNSLAMKGKFSFGEYDDGNPVNLYNWLQRMGFQCSALDFALHYILEDMCNATSKFNMEQLDHAGLQGVAPLNAVTFVENPDTDTDGFATIVWNKTLAYAYILTSEGYPLVYYRDYSTDADCYGLKKYIDNLIWIHENFAHGPTVYRHKEYQFVVYERISWPGLLVGLNNDMYGGWKNVTVQTNFGAHVRLHDYSGNNAQDCYTDANGVVTFGIPPNNNGHGYVCWSRFETGVSASVVVQSTTQVFYGAPDLDRAPVAGSAVPVGRVWCAKNTTLTMKEVSGATNLTFDLFNSNGDVYQQKGIYKILEDGWHTIEVTCAKGSATTSYELAVTYTATQTLEE